MWLSRLILIIVILIENSTVVSMVKARRLTFGLFAVPIFKGNSIDEPENYLKQGNNPIGQILLLIAKSLNVSFDLRLLPYEESFLLKNGSWTGARGMLDRGELDIVLNEYVMNELNVGEVHFAYPLELLFTTFVTRKPEYDPKIFDILGSFSLKLWIVIAVAFVSIAIVHLAMLKREYSFPDIVLHVFAVSLRQPGSLGQKTSAESVLTYSWVVGAMVLCLAFESVVLSFLTLPPLSEVKDVESLAKLVENGEYVCMGDFDMAGVLEQSSDITMKIIARNILDNYAVLGSSPLTFIRESERKKIALLIETDFATIFNGRFYISEQRFYPYASSFITRQNFCCKEQMDMAMHRIVQSGVYKRIYDHTSYVISLYFFKGYSEINEEIKITLTHIAPAIIFLLSGYAVSTVVLILEILYGRRNKMVISKRGRIRQRN